MKIMIDSEPLLPEQLTGIGYNQADTVKRYAKLFNEDELIFSGFALRGRAAKLARIGKYADACAPGKGKCKLFPLLSSGMYRLAWGLFMLPIPYRMFFGGADITHFFNFLIPPGVKGKKVCTVHDLAFRAYPETVAKRTRMLLSRQLGRTLKRADSIVVVSEFTKQELIKYYPQVDPTRIYVVYNGVDHSFFYPREYTEQSENVLGNQGLSRGDYFFYLGTIEPRKNLARAIEGYAIALRRARAEGKELPQFVLGGKCGWYYDEILAKAGELGISDKVKFIGYVNRPEMVELYSHCAAFVFPSLYEGFGIPVAEAMACGAPVITANAASLPEVGGEAAIYIDPLSVESIADAFSRAYFDRELVRRAKELGPVQAKKFTWDRAARELKCVYTETLKRK